MKDIEDLLRRAKAKQLQDADYETIESLGESLINLLGMIKQDRTTIGRLRKMLFGASTEKTDNILGG
ncbi:MAG: IS66 family transposase, partial [Proteobacteria bacterium]|nr:IS66 family transposase [Pseudomonadota bacterium]